MRLESVEVVFVVVHRIQERNVEVLLQWSGQAISARKTSVKSRVNIGKMSLTELNEGTETADRTPRSVAAHFIATIP
jgi:glycosidase